MPKKILLKSKFTIPSSLSIYLSLMNRILNEVYFKMGLKEDMLVRIYLVTKRTILRATILLVMVCVSAVLTLPYKEAVIGVFNTNQDIPIYNVEETSQKKVAITFDCAWGGDDITQIIGILKEYNAKATFFPVGAWMDKYPQNIKALSASGHEIGNHSDSHADLTTVSETRIISEITNANIKIEKLIGKKNLLFRSPYGAYNDKVVKSAKGLGQYVIQWDVDSLDWKDLGVNSIVNRVSQKTKSGSIILLHNDTKYTIQALPIILEKLKSKGYEFVIVSELIYKDNYYIDHLGVQHQLIREKVSLD